MVTTDTFRRFALNRAFGSGSVYASVKVLLIKAEFVPSPDLDLSQIVQADFDGYNQVTVNRIGLYTSPEGVASYGLKSATFTSTGAVNPNTIWGWGVIGGPALELWATELFPEPVPITGPDQGVSVSVSFPWGV